MYVPAHFAADDGLVSELLKADIDGVIAGLRAEGLDQNADDVERSRPAPK